VKVPGAETGWIYESIPWPIYDFEIAYGSRAGLAAIFKYRRRPWPKEGVLVPKGWPSSPDDDDLPKPIREYDPVPAAEAILQDLSRTDVQDPQSMLAFVNRWGLLDQGWYGEVVGARAWLQSAKTVMGDLHALQTRPLSRGRPSEAEWEELDFDLKSLVSGVHFSSRPTPEGLRPVFRAPTLADVIGLRLFELATTSTERLRQCRYGRCRAFFIPDRRDQIYCKTAGEQRCARRASLEKLRARQKRERQRDKRHTRARRRAGLPPHRTKEVE
jgi:hypothetical protein